MTTVPLSPIQVEKGTASSLMGACMQGQTATLNGFACGRATDVNGIAIDTCGRLLVTWPAQAGLPTDATYSSKQTSGPRLRSTVCAHSVSKPVTVPVTKPVTKPVTPTGSGGGSPLAATGGSTALAALAMALLTTGVVVRRRRTR